jgi:BASS family bile acid:Na+ symporter
LPKVAELAKGNLAFSVGAMVLLMVVTVGYAPVVMPLLLPGVTVDHMLSDHWVSGANLV